MRHSRDIDDLRADGAANGRVLLALAEKQGLRALVTETVRDAEYQKMLAKVFQLLAPRQLAEDGEFGFVGVCRSRGQCVDGLLLFLGQLRAQCHADHPFSANAIVRCVQYALWGAMPPLALLKRLIYTGFP